MHYLGSTVQSADIVAAILSWCLAINSCMGVLLRIVLRSWTTCNDTQTGNAFMVKSPLLRKATTTLGIERTTGGCATAKADR